MFDRSRKQHGNRTEHGRGETGASDLPSRVLAHGGASVPSHESVAPSARSVPRADRQQYER
ncbi:hypothetical protein C2R22_17015 [Salinigranum rubrum]|uniref:Uncharacterized protein n=1 Tax=Salinigranum rubrum TaxID=755307 RepID=A0A2I8VMH5_9EURY|nr:hypothetical protein C2R22_17015 [Salinigranum rubrum]